MDMDSGSCGHMSANEVNKDVDDWHEWHLRGISSQDSLDRFGDDLCELLLSYLWLRDSFRYECLSKHMSECLVLSHK
ncbi:unnamed protein product [Oppiella nova]|uniref:Uncharacterized protein n=1 Tax=Oppiella nova TaxID=334625 RepID=A0A7R9MGE4_9ACAR|nr:unnamed protein product [Oppiella nova]CAG2176582.1 unnamed protein product [Oppiella nova]